MKANRIAWLGLACLVGGGLFAASCTDETTSSGGQRPGPCTDGIINLGEECDDGNDTNTDDCTNECKRNVAGDDICNENNPDADGDDCEEPEECEDGSEPPCDDPKCGNGTVDADDGEECDEWEEGETKSNSETCNVDCTLPTCSDAIQNNAAGECCADSGEFPCNDADLLAKKEMGDPDWCLCEPVGTGGNGGAGGSTPCDPGSAVADFVVNKTDPGSSTPGIDNTNGTNITGISSVWNYGGQLGVPAGNEMCAAVGADHVCEWGEILASEASGQLGNILNDGQAFWIHRTTTPVDVTGFGTSAPGPGGRCNDWTYPTNHISDSEVAVYNPANNGSGLGAGWQQVGTSLLYASFDTQTCYTGNPADGCQGEGRDCGGQGAPTGSTTGLGIAIVCCFATCE